MEKNKTNTNNSDNQQIQKNNDKNKVLIVVMALIIVGLAGYIVYSKFIQKDDNLKSKPTDTNTQENDQSNSKNDDADYNLLNIECNYYSASEYSSNETFGVECDKYNPRSLYDKYKLSNNHTIEKMIFANDKLVYLIMSNFHEEYSNENYHEYLYSTENNKTYFANDSYKRIAGIYTVDNKTKVVLYNEVEYAGKYDFKTIDLSNNSIYRESSFEVEGFTHPVVVSKNNKNYIILTLASEYTDRLVLTTDFKKIDIGLAYDGYQLTEEGNIKIFVDIHKYKIYDDAGILISEGQY